VVGPDGARGGVGPGIESSGSVEAVSEGGAVLGQAPNEIVCVVGGGEVPVAGGGIGGGQGGDSAVGVIDEACVGSGGLEPVRGVVGRCLGGLGCGGLALAVGADAVADAGGAVEIGVELIPPGQA
jgi:hypothetical protein